MNEEEKPPSNSNQNNFKLYVPGSRDLYRLVFGCRPLQAGNNSFRSLALLSSDRRNRFLDIDKNNQEGLRR